MWEKRKWSVEPDLYHAASQHPAAEQHSKIFRTYVQKIKYGHPIHAKIEAVILSEINTFFDYQTRHASDIPRLTRRRIAYLTFKKILNKFSNRWSYPMAKKRIYQYF